MMFGKGSRQAILGGRIKVEGSVGMPLSIHARLTNFLSGQLVYEYLLNLNNMSLKPIKG